MNCNLNLRRTAPYSTNVEQTLESRLPESSASAGHRPSCHELPLATAFYLYSSSICFVYSRKRVDDEGEQNTYSRLSVSLSLLTWFSQLRSVEPVGNAEVKPFSLIS